MTNQETETVNENERPIVTALLEQLPPWMVHARRHLRRFLGERDEHEPPQVTGASVPREE